MRRIPEDWRDTWTGVSSLDLCRILRVGGDLFVLCSLPGPPVVQKLMQVVALLPDRGSEFRSLVPLTPTLFSKLSLPKATCLLWMCLLCAPEPTTPTPSCYSDHGSHYIEC